MKGSATNRREPLRWMLHSQRSNREWFLAQRARSIGRRAIRASALRSVRIAAWRKASTRKPFLTRDTCVGALRRPKHTTNPNMNTDIQNDLQEKGEELKRGVGQMMENARDKAGEIYDRARDRVRTWSDDGVEYVRENPTKTLLAALALGFAIGFAARR
jgi:ElaB/YqjD/DUF883 family membrane-anchored ribosome-binding protein